jgi:phosphodiesterase/alkaline phosphatase D-like protein
MPPTIISIGASNVTPFTATLEASVNPEGQSTTCKFEYGTTTAYGTSTPCEPANLDESFNAQNTSLQLKNLNPNTTYYYRVVTENETLPVTEDKGEFTTLEAIKATFEEEYTENITYDSATLISWSIPNYQETKCVFEYGKSNNPYEASIPCTPPYINGDTFAEGSANVKDLQQNTTYHYRVLLTNQSGTSQGPDQTFQTTGQPTATTLTANTRTNAATLNGAPTVYSFEYGYTTGYGQSLPLTIAGKGRTVEAISMVAENLKPNTTYHYRLVAINEGGTSYGEDKTLTTTANPPPVAVTLPATETTQNTATLNGTVNPNGQPTQYEFQIGTSTEYGVSVFFDVGSGEETESVTLPIGDLQPGTTYHYRIVATSEGGTSEGADRTFTTGIFPTAALTAPPTTALLATPPIAFPTPTTPTTTKTTTKKAKSKKKTKKKSKTTKKKRKPKK